MKSSPRSRPATAKSLMKAFIDCGTHHIRNGEIFPARPRYTEEKSNHAVQRGADMHLRLRG